MPLRSGSVRDRVAFGAHRFDPAAHEGMRNICMAERMRTSIVLDDELVVEAMRRTGIKNKRAVVEEARP
jgi:hypothetical protein